MDSINLNKENGQKLWANDWNKLVSTINQIIDKVNNLSENSSITKLSQLTNDAGFITQDDISGKANASDLATVASTGDYNDLLNKPQNQQGVPGDSAYQVAVNNGFTGTEQEWLASLKGETGQDGAPGQDGSNGQDGAPGQNGITPHIDPVTKHWMIGETDTNVLAEGQNGQNGLNGHDGINGTNGTDGITPHIDSTTGNWFIGTTNTGVQAQGPAGQNGSNGTNGSNGQDGVTPHIDSTTGNWFIGTTNTGVHAQGPAGQDGSAANQLQADWNQSNSNSVDFIKNKPTIPSTAGMVTSSTTGLKIEVVSSLPASPDANTIYIVQ